jgi:UDP:flavonoid glycosyltransferase YjiC (YdhE family)
VALFDGEVPHDWLFARASAVVCHGGGGTVHAALTAGCPVVVSPVKPDDSSQAYWGSVVEKRGVGKLSQPAASHKSGKSLAKDIR